FNIQNVEEVWGSQYDDIIIGSGADETFLAGAGADFLDGGEYEGEGSDFDRVDFQPLFGGPAETQGVFVNISDSAVTYDYVNELGDIVETTVEAGEAIDNWGNTDTLSNFEGIRGSDRDDVLVAGWEDNYIEGRDGDDVIVGGGGYDDLEGGGG